MGETSANWSDSTVIDSSELEKYIFEANENSSEKLLLKVYSIEISPQGFLFDDFARYSGDSFVYFVFPEEKVKELRQSGRSPHRRAQKIAGIKKNYKQDGTLGEFILFLIIDGFFDIPMISHKVQGKQNYEQEVFGSDGIYFGRIQGDESIGLGEAKVYSNLNQAVESAIDSIERFHESGSSTAIDQELNIAPTNLSDNLSTEQIETLAEVLTEGRYSDYSLFHPVLICYEEPKLESVQTLSSPLAEKRDEIQEKLADKEHLSKLDGDLKKSSSSLTAAELLFLFLPISDLDKFREEVLMNIDPALKHVMED